MVWPERFLSNRFDFEILSILNDVSVPRREIDRIIVKYDVLKLKLHINYILYDNFDNRSVDEIVWRIFREQFFLKQNIFKNKKIFLF